MCLVSRRASHGQPGKANKEELKDPIGTSGLSLLKSSMRDFRMKDPETQFPSLWGHILPIPRETLTCTDQASECKGWMIIVLDK